MPAGNTQEFDVQRKDNSHGLPVKAGAGPHNRIGTLAEQMRLVHSPRPTPTKSSPASRRVEILEARVAELERLVLILLDRRGKHG